MVRRHDPDRFLCSLFAPAEHRETLFLLYAFNHEIARAREVASQPIAALIRLQWWREVVQGAARAHEVATPLSAALARGQLRAVELDALIEAREIEAEGELERLADLQDYVMASAGALAGVAGRVLGADDATRERLRALGAAYGVAGQIRSVAVLARQGRCLLPAELLRAQGLAREDVIARPDDPRLRPVRDALVEWGRALLRRGGGRFAAGQIAAGLPAVLARRDLARRDLARRDLARAPDPAMARPLGDRMAVLLAAMRRRIQS